MSFFRAFNSCCPFCVLPDMDLEDDYPNLKDIDDNCYFGLTEYEKKYNRIQKRKRFERYENSHHNKLTNNMVELEIKEPKQPQNISNIIVDDILSKIVY